MASCVRNVCAKNRENPSILLKVTIDNVGVPFFETQGISRLAREILSDSENILCSFTKPVSDSCS